MAVGIAPWKLDTATQAEVDEVVSIVRASLVRMSETQKRSASEVRSLLQATLAVPRTAALIARDGKSAEGVLVFRVEPPVVRLLYLGVRFSNEGVGSALLKTLLGIAKTHNTREVRGAVIPDDPLHSHFFIAQHGFRRTEQERELDGLKLIEVSCPIKEARKAEGPREKTPTPAPAPLPATKPGLRTGMRAALKPEDLAEPDGARTGAMPAEDARRKGVETKRDELLRVEAAVSEIASAVAAAREKLEQHADSEADLARRIADKIAAVERMQEELDSADAVYARVEREVQKIRDERSGVEEALRRERRARQEEDARLREEQEERRAIERQLEEERELTRKAREAAAKAQADREAAERELAQAVAARESAESEITRFKAERDRYEADRADLERTRTSAEQELAAERSRAAAAVALGAVLAEATEAYQGALNTLRARLAEFENGTEGAVSAIDPSAGDRKRRPSEGARSLKA